MSPFKKSVNLNKLRVDKDDNGSCQFQPKYEGTRAHQNRTDEKKAFHIDWKKSARTNDYKFNLSTRSEANK